MRDVNLRCTNLKKRVPSNLMARDAWGNLTPGSNRYGLFLFQGMQKYREKLRAIKSHTKRLDLSDESRNRTLFQAYIEVIYTSTPPPLLLPPLLTSYPLLFFPSPSPSHPFSWRSRPNPLSTSYCSHCSESELSNSGEITIIASRIII
jgi:hypothetical protein